jgi:hypothetical protein
VLLRFSHPLDNRLVESISAAIFVLLRAFTQSLMVIKLLYPVKLSQSHKGRRDGWEENGREHRHFTATMRESKIRTPQKA